MIPRIMDTDYGYYALKYFDGDGNVIAPDLDSSLYWEFYDSQDVLQFIANLTSSPPIEQDSDSDGIFFKAISIPLVGWALGIVQVKAFAKKNTNDIEPSPLLANAFEIIQGFYGYCSPEDVKVFTGVKYDDLELSSEIELNIILQDWIFQATEYIDKFTRNSWQGITVPPPIKGACMRITANMLHLSIQRRKSPLVQLGDFNLAMLEDKFITQDIKDVLKMYSVHQKISGTGIFAMGLGVVKVEDREDNG